MSGADHLILGDWNARCFRCQGKFKASQLRKTWEGFYCCDHCWEIRQPQDFVRGIPDFPAPPWVQSTPTDTFVEQCTPNGLTAIPGYAMPGCCVPDYVSPSFNPDGDSNV